MVWVMVMTLYYSVNSISVTTQEFNSYENCKHAAESMRIQGEWGGRLQYVCVEK